MQPSTAEYWHIGAITMRLGKVIRPTRSGSNNLGPVIFGSCERGFHDKRTEDPLSTIGPCFMCPWSTQRRTATGFARSSGARSVV